MIESGHMFWRYQTSLIVLCKNNHLYIDLEKEFMKTIFQPFVTGGKEDGTGLGLAICKEIVDVHQGKIWCESTKNSNTTCFSILLPK